MIIVNNPITIASLGIGQPAQVAFPFGSGWGNFGGGYANGFYSKRYDGWVQFSGFVGGNDTTFVIGTLPVGYRPAAKQSFVLLDGTAYSWLSVDTTGVVTVELGAKNTYVSFNSVGYFV